MMQARTMECLAFVMLVIATTACGGNRKTAPVPTAAIVRAPAGAGNVTTNNAAGEAVTASTPATTLPTSPVLLSPQPLPTPTILRSERLAQYRVWMEEARLVHPYQQSLDQMWAVMICESTARPNVIAPSGLYHGLYQYLPRTWNGRWNVYRNESIYDPRAQIFATAKAWHDGKRSWWEC